MSTFRHLDFGYVLKFVSHEQLCVICHLQSVFVLLSQ